MRKCGIYGMFNMANGKVLVGSSVDIQTRWSAHRRSARRDMHDNDYFQKAWNKYGESMFEFRILEECSQDMLIVLEDLWINRHQSLNEKFGYNFQNASRTVFSDESRQNARKRQVGKKNSFYGKHISPAHKLKLAAGHKAFWDSGENTKETRRKISDAQRGDKHWNFNKHHSEITRNKMRIAHTGVKNHFYGKHHSEEAIKKNRAAHLGKHLSETAKKKCSVASLAYWEKKHEEKKQPCQMLSA